MLWLWEEDGGPAAPQRIVPDGHCELILNWCEPLEYFNGTRRERQSRCFFAGQIERPLLLRSTGRSRMLGVDFLPNGAAALLGASMGDLRGRFTAVDDLSPELGRRLHRVLEARDPFAAVEEALLPGGEPQGARDLMVEAALERISQPAGALDVRGLARDFGMSARHLERRFSAAVGLSPKVYSRILRFNRVFRYLENPRRNWAQTAAECGYYDQAYLIRECQALAGTTPRILLAEDGDLARQFYRRFGVSHSYNPQDARLG